MESHGSGKSKYCFDEITKEMEKEKKIYMITPEQFSFTAENKLMEIAKRKAVIHAEVLTLSRMAYRVLNEIGGKSTVRLTKQGKAMLIYAILNKYKKELKFLGKSDENIDLCINTITELKKHKITPQNLREEIEKIDDTYLKTKLQDITLIYEKFQEQIAGKYIEETDLLTILANQIEKTNIVQNSVIYLDEFAGFTKQEYDIIEKFIKLAKQVNITICTNNLTLNTNPDSDIYYTNKITIAKIWSLVNANQFDLEEPVHMEKQYRFQTKELKYLSENMNHHKSTKYEKDVENIELFLAKNPYEEIEKVAKKIVQLVKAKKRRYKDIAIITKNIQEYSSLVRAIFPKYQIPVFIDEKREVSQNIIIQYVLSILEMINKNFTQDTIFNYLKLGFCEIEKDEIFALENYCNKWGIKQNKWKNDFIYEKEEEKQKIERYNELRKQIIEPILALKQNINENKTAYHITKAIYLFMQEQKIEEKITKKIQELQERGFIDIANEYVASYQTILELFDEIILIFAEDKMTVDQYAKIIRVGLKKSELRKIPGTKDQVTFGDIDRSRSHKVKEVFIIGLNDGSFPSINKEEGFLDDADRQILKQDGIELAKGTLECLYEDNFNIYKAFTTAENSIYLSYAASDKEGKSLRPSMLIYKIKKLYPKLQEKSEVTNQTTEMIGNEQVTYESLLSNIAKLKKEESMEEIWYEVYQYYKEKVEWQTKLQNDLQGLVDSNVPQKINPETIHKLYGNTLKTSVSRLEKYRSCPFSYYLQYGLKLKEKENLKIHTFETGSFMHETIDQFFQMVKEEGLPLAEITQEQIYQRVAKIIDQNLSLRKNIIFTATAKYKALVQRLKKIVSKALKYIIQTIIYSDFSIEGTEIEFSKTGKYKPIVLNLEDGKRIEITGKIDRIDRAPYGEEGKALRIIDYKSSSKNIDLNEVYAGLQIQLLTYLDSICKEEDIMPARSVLFFFIRTNDKSK